MGRLSSPLSVPLWRGPSRPLHGVDAALFRWTAADGAAGLVSTRASDATYISQAGIVTAAGVGVARGSDYSTGQRGLLVESQRTNQALQGSNVAASPWFAQGFGTGAAPVVTANYAPAPSLAQEAARVTMALNGGTSTNDRSNLSQDPIGTAINGVMYSGSVWARTVAGGNATVHIDFSSLGGDTNIAIGSTWQRFFNSALGNDTVLRWIMRLRGATGTSDSADLLVWGVQVEAGAFASSYIPTVGASATRAADAVRATGVLPSGIHATRYEKFFDLATAAVVERVVDVPATTTDVVFADATVTDRIWYDLKYAEGVFDVDEMRGL